MLTHYIDEKSRIANHLPKFIETTEGNHTGVTDKPLHNLKKIKSVLIYSRTKKRFIKFSVTHPERSQNDDI